MSILRGVYFDLIGRGILPMICNKKAPSQKMNGYWVWVFVTFCFISLQ